MRRWWIIALSVSITILLPLIIWAQENAIRNGDFEQGQAYWVFPKAPEGIKISIDRQQPLSGKNSLKLEGTKVGVFILPSQFGLNLKGGDEYVLRFKYRWQQPESGLYLLETRIGVRGPDRKLDLTRYIYFDELRNLQPTGDVEVYERRFSVPKGYTAAFFQFFFVGKWGTIWIDDISITVAKPEDKHVPKIEEADEKPF